MTDFILDPANYVMKGAGKPEPEKESTPAIDLASLHAMTKEDLIALCTRLLCQCGMVATMTKEQTAQAMLDVLAETALKPIVAGLSMKADIQSKLNAIDKWLDRTQGKPAQSETVNLNVTGEVNTTHWLGVDNSVVVDMLADTVAKYKRIEKLDADA